MVALRRLLSLFFVGILISSTIGVVNVLATDNKDSNPQLGNTAASGTATTAPSSSQYSSPEQNGAAVKGHKDRKVTSDPISGKGPMDGGSRSMGGAGGTSDGSTSSGMGSALK